MNIILLEDRRYVITSFMEKLSSLYPKSSILYVNKNNYSDCKKSINTPPLMTPQWCLIINMRGLEAQQLQSLCTTGNVCVINTYSKNLFDEAQQLMLEIGLPFKIINNTKVSKGELINYVSTALNLDLAESKYICARHKYHLPSIIDSVTILSTLDKVDRESIKKYTVRFGSVSLFSLYYYLVGFERGYKFNKIVNLVHDYRYAVDYLVKYLIKELDTSMLLYRFIEEGTLSTKNVKEFKEEFKANKIIASCSEYSIKKNLEMFATVSYDKLYLLRVSLEGISGTRASTYKLINLLKIGG